MFVTCSSPYQLPTRFLSGKSCVIGARSWFLCGGFDREIGRGYYLIEWAPILSSLRTLLPCGRTRPCSHDHSFQTPHACGGARRYLGAGTYRDRVPSGRTVYTRMAFTGPCGWLAGSAPDMDLRLRERRQGQARTQPWMGGYCWGGGVVTAFLRKEGSKGTPGAGGIGAFVVVLYFLCFSRPRFLEKSYVICLMRTRRPNETL